MDVSQVQSGSKRKSDFSIERILSDEPKPREDSTEVPNWLCCTRYQPPRIPRPANSGCRARRSGRHARVPFTAAQAAALEAAYCRAPYLAPPALRALAAALQLRDDRIKIWFQNRRARERREKCTSITPPQAVALSPTSIPQRTVSSNSSLVSSSSLIQRNDVSLGPEDLTASALQLPPYFSHTSSFSDGSDEDKHTDRPETPLDIETVED